MTRKEKTTLQIYKEKVALDRLCFYGKFAMPLIPATAITIINWDEWFAKSGASLPLGFTCLLLAVISAILGITKKDEFIKKKISGLLYLALTFFIFGLSFKFLANVLSQMGDIFLYTALSILGSFGVDQIDKSLVKPEREFYLELVETNKLDPRIEKKKAKKQAKIDKAVREGQQHQATE